MGKKSKKKEYIFWGDVFFDGPVDEETCDQQAEKALELLDKHYKFYGQIKALGENLEEYVSRGAVLKCTHGNCYSRLELVRDHGVYTRNALGVMTCSDCRVNENVFNFGACGNGVFEPLYSEDAPHPVGLVKNNNGDDRYRCYPVLLAEWGHGKSNARNTLIAVNGEEHTYKQESADTWQSFKQSMYYAVRALNERKDKEEIQKNFEEYSQALMTCDNLLCLYGGVITIEENQEPEAEETIPDISEEDERVIYVPYEVDPQDKESVKRYMWNFFRNEGFGEIQVAGILGNVQQESNFKPDAGNKISNLGLFQLKGGRIIRYNAWVSENKLPEEEIVQNQCKFAIEEYENPGDTGWLDRGIRTTGSVEYNGQTHHYNVNSEGTQDDFIAADNPMDAALIWGISFERCFEKNSKRVDENNNTYYIEIQDQEKRCRYALEIYENRDELYYDE